MDYFRKRGAAITADSPEKLAQQSILLLNSATDLQRMENALKKHPVSDGAENVFINLNDPAVSYLHSLLRSFFISRLFCRRVKTQIRELPTPFNMTALCAESLRCLEI